MPRTDSGIFAELRNISLPDQGAMTIHEAVAASLEDIFGVLQDDGTRSGGGASFEGSWFDEIGSIFNAALTERGYRPNGDHLAGRNVESELLAGREELIKIRDDEERDAPLRAAVIPEIAKVELKIQQRDFMKPIRDPEWGGDILELVARVAPHMVFHAEVIEGTEILVPTTVAIKLDSIHVEVDDYGELCVWTYEEGVVTG